MADDLRCAECDHLAHKGACMVQLGHDGHSTQWCNCPWWKLEALVPTSVMVHTIVTEKVGRLLRARGRDAVDG